KGLRFDNRLYAWRDSWTDRVPSRWAMSCQDFLATRIKEDMEDTRRAILRKQVIGPFKNLAEMRDAWELLRLYGEKTAREKFSYPLTFNFAVLSGEEWGTAFKEPTMDLKTLKVSLRCGFKPVYSVRGASVLPRPEPVAKHPGVGTIELREHTIGPFKSLAEMRSAWDLLKSLGEPTARTVFDYADHHSRLRFLNDGFLGWGTVGSRGTMTLQELACFITRTGVLEPVAPIAEPAEPVSAPQVPDHDCSLHWYASLGCCVKCNKDLDPRNKADLYGILDEERRQQEFIAEVKRGRK
ncbi:MAG: hypothetical protein OQK82_04625, partial [Candidatus Pacearchaeota archaeon]|nr:hypothetical protein [Candidatus Pacearchaeota archaeon]